MTDVHRLLTDNIDIWTAADTEKKSGRGRNAGGAGKVFGLSKLRELILELAVHGKLVPQDPNDEPASALLKRLQAEKATLIAKGEVTKDKANSRVLDLTPEARIPPNWVWTHLSAISRINPRNSVEDDITASFVSMSMIGTQFNSAHEHEIKVWKEIKQGFTHFAEGDIAVAKITPCFENSKACVFVGLENGVGAGTTELHVVRPYGETLVPRYVLIYLKSPQFLMVGETKMTGTAGQKRLPKEFVEFNPFPLPPFAEQQRIVAKVDELMALCDQLEAQHCEAADGHEKLVGHLLGTLTNSWSAKEFSANWQRISAHFETLFSSENSIDVLKQTVLQLAVVGKLVPQDSKDEPVERLLHRVKKGQDIRIHNKEIQKPRKVETDTVPNISIPPGWAFKCLGDFAFVTKLAGFEYTDHLRLSDEGEVPVVRAQNVRPFVLEPKNLKFIDLTTSLKLGRSALDRPCLLVTFIGAGIGDVCHFEEGRRWHLAPNVAKAEPFADMYLPYLTVFLNSPSGRYEIFKSMKSTAQPSLSMATIREIWVPIPPLPEQRRIVAKVEELMMLCDRLKSRLVDANQLQRKLADVLVEQAVA